MDTYTNAEGSTITIAEHQGGKQVLITVSRPNKRDDVTPCLRRRSFQEQINEARRHCGIVEGRFLSESSGGYCDPKTKDYIVHMTRAYQRKGAPEASRMVMKTVYLPHNVSLSAFIGDDGAFVVQVDTHSDTGRVRVNINDAPVWDGDPERD